LTHLGLIDRIGKIKLLSGDEMARDK
jgi:hypothetical protein